MKTELFSNTNAGYLYDSYANWIKDNQNIEIISVISPKEGFIIVTCKEKQEVKAEGVNLRVNTGKMLENEINFCKENDFPINEHGAYIYISKDGTHKMNLPAILYDYKDWLIKNEKYWR